MRWILTTVGSPKLEFARIGIADYAARIRKFTRFDMVSIRAAPSQVEESTALLRRSDGTHRIVLDNEGKPLTSREWARVVDQLEMQGTTAASILIGGADGHTRELVRKADTCISLGPVTLQHELAALVCLEQLYRAYTIHRNLPYHRD